jgi:hypothetical protein
MSEETLPYRLYGLGTNPYRHHPLDPVKRPEDRKRWLDLDGFVRTAPVLEYLGQAVENEAPAFVLIGGHNRTGRTSTANWVLDSYAELREVGRRFLTVRVNVGDHDVFNWLRDAVVELGEDVKLTVPGLTQQLIDDVRDHRTIEKQMAYKQVFKGWLRALSVELAELAEPYAFGVLFEGVRSPKFVDTAMKIFDRSQAVVVFTYDDYQHPQTADSQRFDVEQFDDIAKVYLEPLASGQVRMLALGRWKAASPREFPFDAEGLEHLYRNRITPIRAALKRLEDLLNYRLRLAAPQDDEWPENKELFMSRRWLEATFKLMEDPP